MITKKLSGLRHAALAIALGVAFAPAALAAEPSLTCERIPELMVHYLQKHIRFDYPNDELRRRVVELYMRRLDPAKTLYLRAEAEEIEKQLQGVLLDVHHGDCSVLDRIHADLPVRYAAMEKRVTEIVSRDDYAIDPDATLVVDPEERARPATPEERDALYEKLIHFQMANYAVALASEHSHEEALETPGATEDKGPDETKSGGATPPSDPEHGGQAKPGAAATTPKVVEDSEELLEVGPELLAEARKKLLHRYALNTRRAQEITREEAYAGFLDSFARALDPHSNYLSAENVEDFQIQMELSLDGIGVALTYRDGYSIVDQVLPGGAADKLDVLEPSDKIIAVAQDGGDFVDVIDMDLSDVVRLIRGPRGSKVHLRVLRDGRERINVAIVRDKIDLADKAASLRVEEVAVPGGTLKLGLLELPTFYGDRNPAKRQSSRDVRRLLDEAREKGLDGIVLDLSRNGGGALESAIEIAGLFVEDGGVVAVKDHHGGLQVMDDPDTSIAWSAPLVVLTSRISASASEIVAGAMKDYKRAVIVGDDHTFGKGTVQSMVYLQPGLGALKVTTALFFRPGGMSTQHEGVGTDVSIPPAFFADDYGEKYQPYSLESQQVSPFVAPSLAGDASPAWVPVTPRLVSELANLSAQRVEKNEEFREMTEEVEEVRERNGIVSVHDILARNRDRSKDERKRSEEKELSPQQKEALQILADEVRLERRQIAENAL